MKRVSCDHYGIMIEATDPNFNETATVDYLKSLNPVSVELIYHPEKETFPIFQPRFLAFLAVTAIIVSVGTYVTLNKLMYIVPFNWMMEQDKVIPQSGSEMFADGRGMRIPVEGTVAKGFIPYPYMSEQNPTEVLSNPYLPTKEKLLLGQKKYLTYCSPCHGNFGPFADIQQNPAVILAFEGFDLTVDTTAGEHLVTFLKSGQHLSLLFLPPDLRPDKQEVNDGEHEDHRQKSEDAAA